MVKMLNNILASLQWMDYLLEELLLNQNSVRLSTLAAKYEINI